jgi:hypothetical protein
MTLLQKKRQSQENPSLTKMSLEMYPKTWKRARTVSKDSLSHFLLRTSHYQYRGNIGFKYSIFLFEKYFP